ncbi:putative 2og-fe oxygenase protein [Botrytis cinerea BcDW1]|uniref:Putative 2og-fe oxygenase protein n=1 Tax=Botryotinia fuckeliana (strain BcDW1) TaxID=1290391 RepID=M7UFM4_BOTF1|nr:putative 2og-fe oxygenase protein [Botrytis cinerea BcDW1]
MSSSNEGRIPVIDISGSVPQSEVAKQLVDAAATFGFVYIKNLGKDIPVDAIDRTFELSQKFFSSPVEEKLPCKIANNNRGWSGMHTEKLDEKNQRIDPAAGGSNWFSSRHHGGTTGCILRLLYYPSLPPNSDYQPDVDIRAGAHSDYGSITLLFQRPSQPGLEILPPSSSSEPKWTPVPIQPPTTENDPSPPILVNIGDLLSHWTNNLLVSTVHRVIFPKSLPTEIADRYSIAYFCHPVGTTILESVPSERVQKFGEANGEIERKKGEKITADEHLMGRLRATYAGLYEENKGDKKE